ncbi:ThiF family protein [Tenacibaculum skagerrakense]|uniref:ThiF family protein n=1 Tax=Tenacibaculum skagerrakense TaxID=186571 RepID=A0A4R2NTE1_9FLAO|nr:ThiF family adenylyltransferase [Tenacibaculum skagerrakense]TCP24754.1 ThiF family protein [Tenacibaculum skagerrakense]
MEPRYIRNRIYLSPEEQQKIKDIPILLGGSGIGSVIAECALRLGFENITIVDGDQVELSNLNRQNYTVDDISKDKVIAIQERLQAINPEASIKVHNEFLSVDNVEAFIKNYDIAINALDFTTDIPLQFDKLCQKNNITVLHPYNLGWGGVVAVITPDGLTLESIAKPNEKFNEIQMVKYITNYLKFWREPQVWIDNVLEQYLNEEEKLSPPQLSIGSWIVASMCVHVMYNVATEKQIKKFPEFYFSSIYMN